MSEKKYVIYFGDEKELLAKISDVFLNCEAVALNDIKPTFDFLQSSFVEAIVFETYNSENSIGVDKTDLDVLLFYATSESSKNRMLKFYPIDSKAGSEVKAEIVYESLYEKYLFLMQGQTIEELAPEGVALPEGLDLIADLIGTLDDACVDLDENLATSRVSFNSEENKINGGKTTLSQEEEHLVSGGIEAFGDQDQLVKGNRKDLAEEGLKIAGGGPQDESSTVVKGLAENEEEAQLIAGDREDLSEGSTLVNGSKEDLSEENTLISGSAEDLKEEAITVKSLQSEAEDKSKTVIKGSEETIKTEFMTVKNISREEIQEDDDPQAPTINQRNVNGQTPVMLFSKKGDFERAEDLIEKGADITLNCKEGKSVLHYACQNSSNYNLVKFLVEQKGAKVGKRDSQGKDPLYEATISDSPEIVRFLLDQGARINTKIEGNTYLHIAAQKNKIQSFKVLLTFGANIMATNDKGQTVAQFCKLKKKITFLKVMEAVKRLKEKKAS